MSILYHILFGEPPLFQSDQLGIIVVKLQNTFLNIPKRDFSSIHRKAQSLVNLLQHLKIPAFYQ